MPDCGPDVALQYNHPFTSRAADCPKTSKLGPDKHKFFPAGLSRKHRCGMRGVGSRSIVLPVTFRRTSTFAHL